MSALGGLSVTGSLNAALLSTGSGGLTLQPSSSQVFLGSSSAATSFAIARTASSGVNGGALYIQGQDTSAGFSGGAL